MGNPGHVVALSLLKSSMVAARDEMQMEAGRDQVALTFHCYGNNSGYKIVEPTRFFLPHRESIHREKEKIKSMETQFKRHMENQHTSMVALKVSLVSANFRANMAKDQAQGLSVRVGDLQLQFSAYLCQASFTQARLLVATWNSETREGDTWYPRSRRHGRGF